MKPWSTTLVTSIGMFVLMGAGCAASESDSYGMPSEDTVIMGEGATKNDGMMEGDMMKSGGVYEEYSAEKVAQAGEGDGKVVLFFRASWCPSCKAVDGDIRANLSEIPENITILDVNYDDSKELQKKYGVTYQHTFVQVDAEGSAITKWSGGNTLASIVAQVK